MTDILAAPTHASSVPVPSYDAIIVGGGHNGLVCAAYLARAGKRVIVLEARDIVGGYCTTEETVAGAPGFRFNRYAIEHLLVNLPPSVVDDLQLARHGLQYLSPDPFVTAMRPTGETLPIWRDLERSRTEIRRFSPRDADRYVRFVNLLGDVLKAAMPYLQADPKIGLLTALKTLRSAGRYRRSLSEGARLLLTAPAQVLDEWFESEELKIAIAGYGLFGLVPLNTAGNAALAFLPMAHLWGMRRPVGGSGEFTQALMQCVQAHGGEVRLGTPVERIVARHGRVTGVTLRDGQALRAEQVIGALDPVTLFRHLVEPEAVSAALAEEIDAIPVMASGISLFKADVALSRRPCFAGREYSDEVLANGLLAGDAAEIGRLGDAVGRGEVPDAPPIQFWLPSVFDRSLVPAGSEGETMYLSGILAPWKLASGEDWHSAKHAHAQRCLDVLETYAPGVSDSVIGMTVTAPPDTADGVHMGHPYHVDMSVSALGPWRPCRSLAGYRTPIEGLWHTGAGAHPMPGISGANGRITAAAVLQEAGTGSASALRRLIR